MKRQNATSLDNVISEKRESKYVDFKEKFDPNQLEDWCEIIKDMIAMANSGGGWILIGVKDDGQPSNFDVSPVLSLGTAKITDQFVKYTGEQFADFHIQEASRKGHKIVAIHIEGVPIPLVFIRPGTYEIPPDKKQKTSFAKGTVYFRHGSKSEPGNTDDLRKSIERQLEDTRKSWLGNIRRIVSAPSSHKVVVLPQEVQETNTQAAYPIRIVDDEKAPAYRKVWDESPYTSPQEIVIGILKSYKHNKASFASEADMWTLYEARNTLVLDEEKAECLLESAINRHAPFFFWATHLSKKGYTTSYKELLGKENIPHRTWR